MNAPTTVDPLAELRTTATVSVARAAQILGISRGHAYELCAAGGLPVIRLGPQRIRVKSAELLRMIEG